MLENTPLDVWGRDLLTAEGSTYQNPAANFYRAHRSPVIRSESIAQVFLGKRLQCAQCHNHPFDRWTQNEYYEWQAVFGRINYKVLENRRRDSNDKHEFKGEQIIYLQNANPVRNARNGEKASPRLLGEPGYIQSDSASNELEIMAEWLTSPSNPWFARMQANRVWYHLMGRGIVDPIDDFRATNPASHPELLDVLSEELVRSKFDLRALIRMITLSSTYQLSSEPLPGNAHDEINYSHVRLRRLGAEQLLNSMTKSLDASVSFDGYPLGTKASQVPVHWLGEFVGDVQPMGASF